MAKKKTKVSDRLRAAILSSEASRYRISQETGIDQAALSRFMAKKVGLSTDSVDKLAEFLGLELVERKNNPRKGK